MLVILTEEQVLPPQQVCQGCLLADRRGLPRWHQGRLSCAHAATAPPQRACATASQQQPPQLFQCQMGFQLADIH